MTCMSAAINASKFGVPVCLELTDQHQNAGKAFWQLYSRITPSNVIVQMHGLYSTSDFILSLRAGSVGKEWREKREPAQMPYNLECLSVRTYPPTGIEWLLLEECSESNSSTSPWSLFFSFFALRRQWHKKTTAAIRTKTAKIAITIYFHSSCPVLAISPVAPVVAVTTSAVVTADVGWTVTELASRCPGPAV